MSSLPVLSASHDIVEIVANLERRGFCFLQMSEEPHGQSLRYNIERLYESAESALRPLPRTADDGERDQPERGDTTMPPACDINDPYCGVDADPIRRKSSMWLYRPGNVTADSSFSQSGGGKLWPPVQGESWPDAAASCVHKALDELAQKVTRGVLACKLGRDRGRVVADALYGTACEKANSAVDGGQAGPDDDSSGEGFDSVRESASPRAKRRKFDKLEAISDMCADDDKTPPCDNDCPLFRAHQLFQKNVAPGNDAPSSLVPSALSVFRYEGEMKASSGSHREPYKQAEELELSCEEHTDYSLISLIPAHSIRGLEVLDLEEFAWKDVLSLPCSKDGWLLCLIGELLSGVCKDLVPTLHRVVRRSENGAAEAAIPTRVSCALFHYPPPQLGRLPCGTCVKDWLLGIYLPSVNYHTEDLRAIGTHAKAAAEI